MKIGVVDLDTSHPKAWIPIERELGHEVVGLWDGGTVHPAGYAETFARENGVPEVFPDLQTLAEEVDLAIIHACNWDLHIERARPFIDRGKAVLMDKPVAGNPRDLAQFEKWVAEGHRISGGSSLYFCKETKALLAQPVEERGTPHTVFAGCGVDEFNYGIHAWSMVCGLMGPGVESVRFLGSLGQDRFELTWSDGRKAYLVVGKAAWLPFHLTAVTEKAVHTYQAAADTLYRGLLESVLPYLSGSAAEPPVPFSSIIEAERAALAGRLSRLADGGPVALRDLGLSAEGYDGAAFGEEYRRAKYGS